MSLGGLDVLASFMGMTVPAAAVGRGEVCEGTDRLPGLPLLRPRDDGVGICVVNAVHREEFTFYDSPVGWVGIWLHCFP